MEDVIGSLEDVTTERMTRIVQKTDPSLLVDSVRILLSKQLPYSTVARLSLSFASDNMGAVPPELFLKIVLHDAVDPAVGAATAEVDFYKRVAPSMPTPPTLRCFDAATDDQRGRSHLLFNDLYETHSQPKENTASNVHDSLAAIEALARCHARWWNDSRVGMEIGKLMSAADLAAFIANLERTVQGFLDAFAKIITSGQRSAYRSMLDKADFIWGRLTNRAGLTITHGDCHWWNFLFPYEPAGDVYLIDWHLWHLDLGARDLAFLLALGGFAEPRPQLEDQLLGRYHEVLVKSGVANYSFNELVEDYRWSAIRNLNIPVIFWSQGKHVSTVQTTLRRAFESFERLGCRQLIA